MTWSTIRVRLLQALFLLCIVVLYLFVLTRGALP
jgi:hypothetical protein